MSLADVAGETLSISAPVRRLISAMPPRPAKSQLSPARAQDLNPQRTGLSPACAQGSNQMLGLGDKIDHRCCAQGLTDHSRALYTGLVIEGALGHLWRACSGASFVPESRWTTPADLPVRPRSRRLSSTWPDT
jgi:hypothetical protein